MDKLKVFTAFSGYDSQCMALDRLGLDYELVGWSEIDKYAIMAHNAVYPQWKDRNFGDICKIDWNDVSDFDLFTYSFPCGLAGTKVKTIQGYKNIEDVVVGDKVLTHNNRYCEVIRTMSRICPDYYNIDAIGCKLKLTAEHPLYVLRDGVEQWVKVKDLQKTDKLSYCIPQGDVTLDISDKKLWLLGRYVADGFINKHLYNSVLFAICNKKEPEFLANVPCEFKDKFRKFQKSCIEYRIADKDFHDLCMEFGNGAINKHIPEWLFSANLNQIEHFLNGYFSGDGHVRYRSGNKVQMFTTVSKDLFLGLQLLILKCYGKVCSLSIRHDNRKTTFNDTYNGQISFSVSAYQKIINDKIFVSIKSIEKVENKVQVYNLEVRKDNSYTCDNVNTHNCTDISSAGQQKGLTEGSGTRSSLLWECKKAIETKKPKYLLMENVKALTSKKFMSYLKQWLSYLNGLGYSNFAKILNAKDYGVPQNRERVFVVSIMGNSHFSFPEQFILDKSLETILDNNVEDGFYLYNDAIRIDKPADEKMFVKYTRDKRGVVVGRRLSSTSNTVHTSTGSGGNTDCFVFEPKIIQVGNIRNEKNFKNPQRGRVYNPFGVSPTIDTMCGGQREPKILTNDYRIRKLTPRECFRLMGVSEENIDKIQDSGISKTQQYKMAGNSIVVDVLFHIFRKMFIDKKKK